MQTLELDALQELGEEIASLAAHLHAATHRLLTLIVKFDRRRGWAIDGHRSCAHWLAFRTGIDLGAAREKVRAARALERLPQISAAMARGELSFAKVRSLTRVARARNEAELLELAQRCTAAQLERVVRGYSRHTGLDEAALERMRHRSRCLSVFPDEEGMYVIRGRLDPEVGALLMRAIEAASDALFAANTADEIEPAQRRADALGLLAERALAAGLNKAADADTGSASGTRAERYQVLLHVEPATLQWGSGGSGGRFADETNVSAETSCANGSRVSAETSCEDRPAPRAELEDGTRVAAETARRLSCDASVVRVQHDDAGTILDVGRKRRTIPPALRRALEVRDGGCRFPGCGLRFTDAHHMIHWADGGRTCLDNTILLCRYHHRLVHEEGFRVELVGEHATFYNARGLPVPDLARGSRDRAMIRGVPQVLLSRAPGGQPMGRRPNYGFEKRQKELKRQQKKDEKAAKKAASKEAAQPPEGLEPVELSEER